MSQVEGSTFKDEGAERRPLRLGILLSGSGTTLQNLAEVIRRGELEARIACVISSRSEAYGLVRAAELGLPAYTVRRKDFDSAEAFSAATARVLEEHGVDLVCLAGYLALWTIPEAYLGCLAAGGGGRGGALPRVMNIHPALMPKFCGKGMHGHHVHEAVLAAGERESGCTVHFADNQYDHGPIILQRKCAVLAGDTAETLAKRVFAEECAAYPEAIRLYGAGRLRVEEGRVVVR